MKPVVPGQKIVISATDWNSMQEAADAHRRSKTSGGAGILQAAPPERFKNADTTDIPQYGVGWLNGASFQGVNLVEQPPYPGVSKIVIASMPGIVNSIFEGWTTGLHPVRVAADQFADIAVGDRIGATWDSWDAVLDPLGPMTVTGKLDSPVVMALITGRRGGSVRIHDHTTPAESYPCSTLILSGRIRCRQVATGGIMILFAESAAGTPAGNPYNPPFTASSPIGGVITIVCKYTFGYGADPFWWSFFPVAGFYPALAYYPVPGAPPGDVFLSVENDPASSYVMTNHGDEVVEVELE